MAREAFAEYLEYLKDILQQYEGWSEQERKNLEKDIGVIEKKMQDPNLYLGVIGSFSSGKSTFINAVMERRIMPTDAIQGTTVTASMLKYAEKYELEVAYTDGTVWCYGQDSEKLCGQYNVKRPSVFITSVYNFFLRLFGWTEKVRKADRKAMQEIFRKVSSTEELAKDVEYAALSLPQSFGLQDIAIVDTPGTESENPRHNEVTRNAIANLCDAFVVVIPCGSPVSQTLLSYLNTELKDQLHNCIFVVTKVETLTEPDELPRLMRVIKSRLEKGLEMTDIPVFPMPTLLHLEETDLTAKKSGLLDEIEPETRKKLLLLYDEGIEGIRGILKRSREAFAQKNLYWVCKRANEDVEQSVQREIETRKQTADALKREKLLPIETFDSNNESRLRMQRESRRQEIESYRQAAAGIVAGAFRKIRERLEECSSVNALVQCLKEETELQNGVDVFWRLCDQATEQMRARADTEQRTLLENAAQQYRECPLVPMETPSMPEVYERNRLRRGVEGFYGVAQIDLNSLVSEVQQSTTGFFRGLKAFLIDPTEKQKQICEDRIEHLNQMLQSELVKALEQTLMKGESAIEENKRAALRRWMTANGPIIRSCIAEKENAIQDNACRQKQAEETMAKLKEYMRQLGGKTL